MEKVEYNDIVFLEKLNDIKTTIRNSGFRVDYRRSYEVDKKMREIIDDFYDEKSKTYDLYKKLNLSMNRSTTYLLSCFYFALYQDNMDLFVSLLEKDIGLIDDDDRFYFELLDCDFTKYFEKDQYLFLMQYCKEELIRFYHNTFESVSNVKDLNKRRELMKELNSLSVKLFSKENPLSDLERKKYEMRLEEISEELKTSHTYKYSQEERESFCHQFVDIMMKNPFICKDENHFDNLYIFLTPEVLKRFSTEEILQMNPVQKELLSEYASIPPVLNRIENLFKTYPDYHTPMDISIDMFYTFTDEELYHFPLENIPLFKRASDEHIVYRYRDTFEKNEHLKDHPEFVRRIIYDSLTNDEIAGLSDQAIHKICNLVVHTRTFDDSSIYRLKKSNVRIMKFDRFLQKVKKFIR